MTPDRLAKPIRAGELTLIDVRAPAEWNAGHIRSSRSVPLSELGDGGDMDLGVDAPTAVVCASGARAALAASILRRRGHDPVWRVSGGVEQFAPLGVPIESGQS